ncbi:MAG TPA: hypothetical protein VFJ19_09275 [Nocardioidaceae bacterium]|nr:hypothetical protein [Nocardioidaceae bacterium]
MLSNYATSLIRTGTPLAVGWLVAWLSDVGVSVDSQALTLAIVSLLSAAYYALVRLLEARWPQLGWLLGAPVQPTYTAKAAKGQTLPTTFEDALAAPVQTAHSGQPADIPTKRKKG